MSRALLEAAARGELVKVQQHLTKGVDVNCVHKPTGRTPLIEATIQGHLDMAKILIEAGANVNHFDTAVNFSPLLWACQRNHEGLVDLLLSASADVNGRSRDVGWMPLLVAAQNGSLPLLQKLLDAGADLHASTNDGRTALAMARAAKNNEIAAILEARGCHVENTSVPPQRLPWPDVDDLASNVDFNRPESVLRGWIIAMNRYEQDAPSVATKEELMAQKSNLYGRFCTEKERVYGSAVSYGTPLEYDPAAEFLIESNTLSPGRTELVTHNDSSRRECQYVLLKKGGRWLLDSKKDRLIGGDWSRAIL